MMGVFLVIVALCAVAQAQVENKWSKVKSPFVSIPSKMFRNSIHSHKYLGRNLTTGGQAARLGQFPFQALLTLKDSLGDPYDCGGSIVSYNWILTAAHWFEGFED